LNQLFPSKHMMGTAATTTTKSSNGGGKSKDTTSVSKNKKGMSILYQTLEYPDLA